MIILSYTVYNSKLIYFCFRSGPVEVDAQTAFDLEQQIASDLQTSEDSDSEESDTVPYEWEAVSTFDHLSDAEL